MKHISSRDNAQFKELKQLATSAAARKKAGLSLLDGVHLCQAFLQQGGHAVQVIFSESSLTLAEVARLLSDCEAKNLPCLSLPDALYSALSQVENGVGVLMVVATPRLAVTEVLKRNAVLLDGLQDPGNMGSILRSAAAAGISQIYCSQGCVAAWSPKVLRAGMGAHFLLEIFEGVALADLIAQSQIAVIATSSHTETSLYQCDLNRPVAWLFGHEGQGVSAELMVMAKETVIIPQRPEIESLNVAASAAICFFEQYRQISLKA